MAEQSSARSGITIIKAILDLTRKMCKSGDYEYLSISVDRREELMEEYDAVKATTTGSAQIAKDKAQIDEMVAEIMELDNIVNKTLISLRDEAKGDLSSSTKNMKILNYTNQAISSRGTYMDVKE